MDWESTEFLGAVSPFRSQGQLYIDFTSSFSSVEKFTHATISTEVPWEWNQHVHCPGCGTLAFTTELLCDWPDRHDAAPANEERAISLRWSMLPTKRTCLISRLQPGHAIPGNEGVFFIELCRLPAAYTLGARNDVASGRDSAGMGTEVYPPCSWFFADFFHALALVALWSLRKGFEPSPGRARHEETPNATSPCREPIPRGRREARPCSSGSAMRV